ncbi:LysR family transcriptional regulator [Aureimonas altamirensis]|uniref:LysR family transcriptional regulator n=1 Tax=Aureimonas altamirensis TaxID=370622 RepID=UPI001E2CD2FE|nr:LysR family transcriptional regulator [Aureimonas altamirensis]UHD45968.1 LysR family transcriptional regulator [Aureimonas altamirensis]
MDRIDALRLLIDVAEMGSFSGVSRQRMLATSTVALAITQLETEFGVRLMTRSTRRLVMTHEGNELLVEARRIVSEWDNARDSIADRHRLAGPIRISATNDFGRSWLRPLLDRFQEQHPHIHVTLLFSDLMVDMLQEHIDVALRSGPLPDSTLRARLLIRGNRLVCASPDYWRRAGRPKHPDELAAHNCMILARPGAPLAPWPFRQDGKIFNVRVAGDRATSDGDVVRSWALEGRGVALKNHWDIRDDLAAGRLETVLDDFAVGQVDLYVVQPAGPPNRRVNALVEFLSEAAARVQGQGRKIQP